MKLPTIAGLTRPMRAAKHGATGMYRAHKVLLHIARCLVCIVGVGVALTSPVGATDVSLKLTAVEVVDLQDQPHSLWTRMAYRKPPAIKILKISFSSDIDLVELARQNQYHVGRRASICNGEAFDKAQDLAGDSGVYDRSGYVDAYREIASPVVEKHPPYEYYIYINLEPIWKNKRDSDRIDYDLKEHPADVCIEVRGGVMFGGFFAANTLRISKWKLARAIGNAKRK